MKAPFLFLLFLAAAPAWSADKKVKSNDISSMIIQGQNRLQVVPEPPDDTWIPSLYRDVGDLFADNAALAEIKPPSLVHPPTSFLPNEIHSGKTARPWLDTVREAPLLTLAFKNPDATKMVRWTFWVKDSQGRTFYELKKKGRLPDKLTWDGIGDHGVPLRVGQDYSFAFSIVDEAGNPKRFAGDSFRLGAFRYPSLGRTVTAVTPDSLFPDISGARLSPQGQNLLTEIKDHLRTRFGARVDVTAYEDDASFAESRARVVREFLRKALDIPEDKIGAQGRALKGSYKHVDIIVK
jgi:hypothetical protein